MRHQASGGTEGIRQAAWADLHTIYQGWDRWSRWEYFLWAEYRSSWEILPRKRTRVCRKASWQHHCSLQKMCRVCTQQGNHHCRYKIRVWSWWGRKHGYRWWDADTGQLPFLAMNQDMVSHPLTNSLHVTGWKPIRTTTGHFRRRSLTRLLRNISRHTKCLQEKNWPEK